MAQGKTRKRRMEPRASSAAADRPAPRPNPPRRNLPLLIAAILLVVVWLFYLLAVAWFAWRSGAA